MALARRFVIAFTLMATALAVAPISHADAAGAGPRVTPRTGLPVGFMPMRHSGARSASSFSAAITQPPVSFTYRGGPVVSNAAVENVLWGSSAANYLPEVAGTSATTDINTIMGEMFASPWAHALSEYSTPTQTIGSGSVIDRRSITPSVAASGATVDDSTIQAELLSQVTAGALTAPTANTVYTLYFPLGTKVCDAAMGQSPMACSPQSGADNSNAFCGYHGATNATYNGHHLVYVVQPYADSFYAGGCGSPGQTIAESLESVVSHELSETITDPFAGLNDASQLGWYDDNYGEVADLCQTGMGPWTWNTDSVGYRDSANTWFHVQQVWSNAHRACAPGPVQRFQATAIPGGHIRLSWTAAADQAQDPAQGYDIYEHTSVGWRGVVSVGGTAWISPSLPYGRTVAFEVIAWSQSSGLLSHRSSNVVPVVPASTPSAVPWIRTLRGGTSPIVGWAPAPANYSPVTKYILTGPGGTRYLSPATRSFRWTYLKHGRYLITVRAVNRLGYGVIRRFYLVN